MSDEPIREMVKLRNGLEVTVYWEEVEGSIFCKVYFGLAEGSEQEIAHLYANTQPGGRQIRLNDVFVEANAELLTPTTLWTVLGLHPRRKRVSFRGSGLGKWLVRRLIRRGRELGVEEIVGDPTPEDSDLQRLLGWYKRLGFEVRRREGEGLEVFLRLLGDSSR